MRTKISPENPFPCGRNAFAWEKVPRGSRCHLDFGCHQGRFLDALRTRDVSRQVGIDAAGDAIEAGSRKFVDIELLHRTEAVPLPFADATFDSISLLDVLEHLHEQQALLDEFHRVLKPDGILIVTVPHQYILSFLDLGNLKFRFPRLHCWFYCLTHTKEEYHRRYVSNPDNLVGDISAEKRWHEHFTRAHLAELLGKSGFEVIEFDGGGFFRRLILPLSKLFDWIPPVRRMLGFLQLRDARRFESMDLFCTAGKRTAGYRADRDETTS